MTFDGCAVVGAFTAVAASGRTWRDDHTVITPRRLELPSAVLVHAGHSWMTDHDAAAVGVAVPVLAGERIVVEVVLATRAAGVSPLLRSGAVPAVSIVADRCQWETDTVHTGRLNLSRGVLVAVDLADVPMDFHAQIERVTYVDELSEGQRRTRAALDAYLADGGPGQVDFYAALEERGVAAFDPLAPVVEALRCDVARLRRAEERRQVREMLMAAR